MAEKLDIFEVLRNLNRKNLKYYDGLPPDLQKAAAPLVVMRWLSGTSDRDQVLRLNQMVNPYVFSLNAGMLFKLMAIAATGRDTKCSWVGGKKKSNTNTIELLSRYFECSKIEAKGYVELYNNDDLLVFAEELGYTDKQNKELFQELGIEQKTKKSRGAKN